MRNITLKRFAASALASLLLFTSAACAELGTDNNTGSSGSASNFGDKPVVVYGAALDEAQEAETLELMTLPANNDMVTDTVGSADIERYLGLSNVSDSVMISSVAVVGNDDQGVRVQIATPDNITSVQDHQYVQAAITAGIANVDIIVSAISPVTGQSALTGVYKAAESAGVTLNEGRLQAGADELDAVVEISEGKSDEEKQSLTDALNEIKIQISDSVIQTGNNNISTGDITVIMENVFNEFNINISEDQQAQLLGIFERFRDSLTPDDAQLITDQLREFGEKAADQAQDFFEKAQESGLWDKIVEFFREIAEWFQGLF